MIWHIGHALNFKYKRTYLYKQLDNTTTSDNVTLRSFQMLTNKQANITIGFLPSTPKRDVTFSPSYSYHTTNLVWVIPTGDALTAWQIFTMPFQRGVWFFLIVALMVGSVVIAVVKKCDFEVRKI